jgi:glycosyltransferase involved in cell wall biosynthesis
VLRLIERFERHRVRPALVVFGALDRSRRDLAPPADCPTLTLGLDEFRSVRLAPALLRLAAFLRRERIELLQLHHPWPTAAGILAGWLAGTPRLVRARLDVGDWVGRRFARSERLAGRICDATWVNCVAAGAALQRAEAIDARRIREIPTGIDTARFSHLAPGDTGRSEAVVGFVGRLDPVKNPEGFVRAAALVLARRPRARVAVAGEGPLRPGLAALAADLGIAARFDWRGEVADIVEFLAGVDIVVSSSRAEGLPNALLEAMAAARPVVATAVGGVPELVRDGVEGLLVPPDDPAALATAVDRLLADPALARRLGESGRARCLQGYDIADTVRRLTDLYESLLSAPPRSRLGRLALLARRSGA